VAAPGARIGDVTATEALLAVSALHAAFQLVVSVVVYPALADVPAGSWAQAHADHSRRITWLVAPLYAAVAGVGLWVLLSRPVPVAALVALGGHAVAVVTTALVAAPTHGRLGREGKQPELVRRLLLADRVRTAGALVALVAALVAVTG
jgi:hypothetical protein